MAGIERRAHNRVDSFNLLAYSCHDKNNETVAQGMGRTLNISESGILLETSEPIAETVEVILTVAFRDEVVALKGRVVRAMPGYEGKFESGIRFHGLGPGDSDLLRQYIKAFKEEYRHRHERVDSINLIAYRYYDEQGALIDQGMGRTLNVSESGILLETQEPLEKDKLVSLDIALNEDVLDIQGIVVRFSEGLEGRFESGIEFMETSSDEKDMLRRYIEAFGREYGQDGDGKENRSAQEQEYPDI